MNHTTRSTTIRILALVTCLVASPGWTKTLYVEKWGISANVDCTRTAPCRTINAALDVAGDNDRIIVGPGIYNEHFEIDIPGLKMESTGGRYATIIDNDMATSDTIQLSASRIVFGKKGKGFTVIGATTGPVAAIFVNSPDASTPISRIRIEGNRIGQARLTDAATNDGFANRYGILVNSGGERIQIRNNIFQNNALDAIECSNCLRALIRDNRMESNGESGIEIMGDSDGSIIERNVVIGNNSNGIVTQIGTSDLRIKNNVSEYNRGGDGFTLINVAGARVESNISGRNDDKGFDLFQSGDANPLSFKNNLTVGNDNDGVFGFNLENARIESNSAIDNGDDGIDLTSTDELAKLKSNNTYGNGNCGLEGDSGDEYIAQRHFVRENSGGGTCDASFELTNPIPSVPGRLKVNRARSLLGG